MPTTNLYLRAQNNDKPRPVILFFSFDGKRVKLSTGEKILPKYWNEDKQQIRKTFTGSPEINANLTYKKELVNKIYRDALLSNIAPTNDYIRSKFNENKQVSPEQGFFDFVEKFIEQAQSTKAKRTVISYVATKKILLEFQKRRKAKITFECIDMDFYYEFLTFLIDFKQYATNTVGGFIKELRVFLNDATDRGINKNMAYRNKKFKVIYEDADTIYLNQDEIKALYELDLSKNSRLDKVRDLFLIGCYTGLRISDLKRLNKTHLKDGKIHLTTQKTGERVVIPFHWMVRQVIEKYDGNIPPTISEQKYNSYLKDLGKLAEISEPINKTITKAGKAKTETQPKYKMITSHTARRSFATNAYKSLVPILAIMKITGHKTERSFLKYIKVSKEENAELLVNHPFFNQ